MSEASSFVVVRRRSSSRPVFRCRVARSYFEKFQGVMLQQEFEPLLFVFGQEDRLLCAIHSLFCLVGFDAVFLDSKKRVVDVRLGIKPFSEVFIVPKKPAKYLVECMEGSAEGVKEGDELEFEV